MKVKWFIPSDMFVLLYLCILPVICLKFIRPLAITIVNYTMDRSSFCFDGGMLTPCLGGCRYGEGLYVFSVVLCLGLFTAVHCCCFFLAIQLNSVSDWYDFSGQQYYSQGCK